MAQSVPATEVVPRQEAMERLGVGALGAWWWIPALRDTGLLVTCYSEADTADSGFTRASVEAEVVHWQDAASARRRRREINRYLLIGGDPPPL